MDKLAAITAFVKIVELGNFTRAAQALGLPKGRVSQRVTDLENALGLRLLNRNTRSLTLTSDGQAYFAKCQQMLQDLDELEGTLKGGALSPRGPLHVEALASIARWVIAPRLHEFHALYPDIAVQLRSSDRISQILEDGLDCVIRGGALQDSNLIARHVCDVHIGLYATPAYLATAGTPAHPQELAAHRRITWFSSGAHQPFAWRLVCATDSHDVPATNGLRFDDPDAAIASCMAGGGICPGAPFAVAKWVREGSLVPVLPAWHFAARPIHIVYPHSRHLSARVRCFVDWSLGLMQSMESMRLSPLTLVASAQKANHRRNGD